MEADGLLRECNIKIGIYGWKNKCLYSFIFALIIITVVVNLTFTLWALKIMQFSSKGMGPLSVTINGIKLDGAAFILGNLISTRIKSRTGRPITIESIKNLSLKSANRNGALDSQIFIGDENIEIHAKNVLVSDEKGEKLFSINNSEIRIGGTKLLKVTGENGCSFHGSVQTATVLSQIGHHLSLESPTNSLRMRSSKDVVVESKGGKIEASAPYSISFASESGAIHVESSSVLMPKLKKAKSSRHSAVNAADSGVYQMCVCESGKMFLAAPDSICSSQNDNDICR